MTQQHTCHVQLTKFAVTKLCSGANPNNCNYDCKKLLATLAQITLCLLLPGTRVAHIILYENKRIVYRFPGQFHLSSIRWRSDYIIGFIAPAIGSKKSKKPTRLIATAHNIRGKGWMKNNIHGFTDRQLSSVKLCMLFFIQPCRAYCVQAL